MGWISDRECRTKGCTGRATAPSFYCVGCKNQQGNDQSETCNAPGCHRPRHGSIFSLNQGFCQGHLSKSKEKKFKHI